MPTILLHIRHPTEHQVQSPLYPPVGRGGGLSFPWDAPLHEEETRKISIWMIKLWKINVALYDP